MFLFILSLDDFLEPLRIPPVPPVHLLRRSWCRAAGMRHEQENDESDIEQQKGNYDRYGQKDPPDGEVRCEED